MILGIITIIALGLETYIGAKYFNNERLSVMYNQDYVKAYAFLVQQKCTVEEFNVYSDTFTSLITDYANNPTGNRITLDAVSDICDTSRRYMNQVYDSNIPEIKINQESIIMTRKVVAGVCVGLTMAATAGLIIAIHYKVIPFYT
jgi:hypothetical protein